MTRYLKRKRFAWFACVGSLCLSLIVAPMTHANDIPIGRYLSVHNKATQAQHDLLQQQIQIKFPQNILTLQQALHFMLQFSGYRLMAIDKRPLSVSAMLSQPLPEVVRNLGPITLEQGILTLVGPSFYLLIDPVHRLLGFKLKKRYGFFDQTTFLSTSVPPAMKIKKK